MIEVRHDPDRVERPERGEQLGGEQRGRPRDAIPVEADWMLGEVNFRTLCCDAEGVVPEQFAVSCLCPLEMFDHQVNLRLCRDLLALRNEEHR